MLIKRIQQGHGMEWREGNVLYIHWSSDYTGVHTCQNASNSTLKIDGCILFYVHYTPMSLGRKAKKWLYLRLPSNVC